ncbi:UNVERIFIED_CONTAM: hypothetical protein NCL1_43163 [Trichonephila clavipes]
MYDTTENLSFDAVIIKFKGKVFFKQYIPKKCKQWGLKMYKLADATGYTYDMRVYLGKDKKENLSTSASYVVYTMADCIKVNPFKRSENPENIVIERNKKFT